MSSHSSVASMRREHRVVVRSEKVSGHNIFQRRGPTVAQWRMDEAMAAAADVLHGADLQCVLKRWLLQRWAGVAAAPQECEVVMLSTRDMSTYDPGQLLFVRGRDGGLWA